ncbi:glycosyltransferase family 4 protein [Halomonas maura]|uniref:glycosyltransferase family 4 protein n=1 Tax=Halomonas maura TaxID=117606 RepID=UPI0025B2C4EF|nr:glycosyltransferase family 4 protein [Halomonas maura]MDN3555226.1 glycosyltransferase family 4 protein [Halomonas maura]
MKILINTSKLRFGGAVQVALSFLYECRRHHENDYYVVVGPGVGNVLTSRDFPDNFHFIYKDFGAIRLYKLQRVQREMSAVEANIIPDCVVTTSGPSYWRSKAPHLMGFNLPLFIYPESPFVYELSFPRKVRLLTQRWVQCNFFRRDADALIVQTDDVNQRVQKLLGTDRVFTVTNNHGAWYDSIQGTLPRLPERSAGVFRFLTLTSYYPHKNLDLIEKVIEKLPKRLLSRVEFVLTLTEKDYLNRIASHVPSQIRLIGPVPPPECPGVYAECDAMFLPTLAECFSASYAEAMKMQKPILTTDMGFARSVCQDAALYFSPGDSREAAFQVERLVDDPALQVKLKKTGIMRLAVFDTPSQRATKILRLCNALVNERAAGLEERIMIDEHL